MTVAAGVVGAVAVAVVAAHRREQPLHRELLALGARFVRQTRTAPLYRLLALPGDDVPRGGLVRVADGGASVEVEVFDLPVGAVGGLVMALPAPLALGTLELADGATVRGIVCESWIAGLARDVTEHGSWPAYLAAAHQRTGSSATP
jgi:allophanate hydrolase